MESEDVIITAGADQETPSDPPPGLTRAHAFNLYLSHALSTWNARGYEFAAILFTAAAYPDTLVAAALRMIIIYIAMIVFSSFVGHWVERSPSRLRTLLSTIYCNRASVILGSFFWLLILSQENLLVGEGPAITPPRFALPRNDTLKGIIFVVAVAFGIIERLSASANLISMERDWVVTVAGPIGHPYDLTNLNAVMRRIDLVCKLIAPILISIIISATGSIRIGVLYTGLTSFSSVPIELLSARRVWNGSAALQTPKPLPSSGTEERVVDIRPRSNRLHHYFKGFEMYFSSPVWIPSFALAMLHFNMLTWRATFITYLINTGYSLNVITIARAIGSILEISSTVITPWGVVYLGKIGRPSVVPGEGPGTRLLYEEQWPEGSTNETETVIGLQRLGLWGISSQLINTVPVVLALWALSAQRDQPGAGWSVVLFSFLAFSRLGVWVYDLTTQQLTQTLVDRTRRSSFAGVESSVVNVFEVLGAAAAIAFPRVEQYRWLALASLASVLMSWCMYAWWVNSQRGHLVHWEKITPNFGGRR
ncbi:putative solute carrier family 40 (iron-regulated transporter) protein [Rosellinia necatrix]|uniref:Solute carrier family 40 member n=1 Tax=Rosellinia necatrix TaxID=77044 RepID=A0A1S7UHM8_ROSNE|nr:putative solute carrier family 40 (iron-regulated transporter) protein [Rosellinia necatrix]